MLPEWDSAAGFKLREDFVSNLNSPLAHEALQEVLHSGRGVFRNFRNVIKDYLPNVTDIYAYEVKYKYHIKGDKKYIYKTDILKKVAPTPTFPGEKNINPFILFLEADKYGKLFCVNQLYIQLL